MNYQLYKNLYYFDFNDILIINYIILYYNIIYKFKLNILIMSLLNLSINNSQYQIISDKGKIENDKDRIKRKFLFQMNNDNESVSSFNNSNKNFIFKQSDSPEKIINDQININNINSNNNTYNYIMNNLSNNINNEFNDSYSSSPTQILDSQNMRNRSKNYFKSNIQNNNNNILNNINLNSNNFLNEEYYNLNDNENNENNSNINNIDNKILNKTQNNLFFNNSLKNFFINSHRTEVLYMGLLDDEHTNMNHQNIQNNFKFINEIKNKNNKIENIDLNKFLNLSDKIKYKIFEFIYPNLNKIMNINKSIRNNFLNLFYNKYEYIINNFNEKYNKFLTIKNYKFMTNEIKRKKKYFIFSLYLTCEIINTYQIKKYENISYEISYNFIINKKYNNNNNNKKKENKSNNKNNNDENNNLFFNIFKLDIHTSKIFPIWLCSEVDEKNIKSRRLLYTSPVMNYYIKDKIIFRIDLIEDYAYFENIDFKTIKIETAPKFYYVKSIYKNDLIYDGMRDCDIEVMILRWKKLDDNNELKSILNKNFEKYFNIGDVYYDEEKIFFYKVTMKAIKCGLINKRLFNINLEILDDNENLKNECVYISMINTFTNKKKFQIRKGTEITLYLTDVRKFFK